MKSEDIVKYLQAQEWYMEWKKMVRKYNHNANLTRNIINGVRGRWTMVEAFPFADLEEEEKKKWIERSRAFQKWYCGAKPEPTEKEKKKEIRRLTRKIKAREKKRAEKQALKNKDE